jgi:hypothetical protein
MEITLPPRVKVYTYEDEVNTDLDMLSLALHDIISELSAMLEEAAGNNFTKVTTDLQYIKETTRFGRDPRLFAISHDRFARLMKDHRELRTLAKSLLEAQFPNFTCRINVSRYPIQLVFTRRKAQGLNRTDES